MPGSFRKKNRPARVGHNGGRTQVNLNFVASRGIFAFVDMMKNSGSIQDSTNNGPILPSLLNVNGLPTSGTYYKTVELPLQSEKPGDYLIRWVGGGPNTVMRTPGGTIVSGSLNGADGTCRVSIANTPGGHSTLNSITVGVATTGASYSPVTSISVVNVNDDALWQADPNAITPELVSAFTAGGFGVVRFLNMQGAAFSGANSANWTDWASRKPLGYHSFQGGEYRATWWGGTPDNGGIGTGHDFTLTTPSSPTYAFGNGAPVDKQIMHVRFGQAVTDVRKSDVTISGGNTILWSGHVFTGGEAVAIYKSTNDNLPTLLWNGENYYVVNPVAGVSFQLALTPGGAAISSFGTGTSGTYGVVRLCTLNINGTGAKPIRNQYGDQPSASDMPVNASGSQAVYGTMVFDADFNSWCLGGGNSNESSGLQNGTPPEVLLNIAIKLRAHPWFVSSMFALDPMTDFWPTFAAYVRDNAPSWMIPRFEVVNEQWNFAAAFWGTRYGWNKAWHHWKLRFSTNSWQGKIASTLGQALVAVYGKLNRRKYWHVNACQAAAGIGNNGNAAVTQNNERMNSTAYVGQAAAAQAGYTKTPAYRYSTHTSFANYTTPRFDNSLEEVRKSIRYAIARAAGNEVDKTTIQNEYADGLIDQYVTGSAIFTAGSPGVVNWPSHGRSDNEAVCIYSQGTLFNELKVRNIYFVKVVDADHFNLMTSRNGTAFAFTGSQSGNHTITHTSTTIYTNTFNACLGQSYSDWAKTIINDEGIPLGVTPYEGQWSPTPDGNDSTASVTAVTNEAQCKVTLGSTTNIADGSSKTGIAAQVGGSISFASVGGATGLNTGSPFNVTFAAGGSADISGANSLVLGQAVSFRQTVGQNFKVPQEIIEASPYYVVQTGNPFRISKTKGGPPIVFEGAVNNFLVAATPGWFVLAVNGLDVTLDVDSTSFGTFTSGGTATYTLSGLQVYFLRMEGRLAPNAEGLTYGDTWPVPSIFASLEAAGVEFPSKFDLTGTREPWASLMYPNAYGDKPTTGEWIGIKKFSPEFG